MWVMMESWKYREMNWKHLNMIFRKMMHTQLIFPQPQAGLGDDKGIGKLESFMEMTEM